MTDRKTVIEYCSAFPHSYEDYPFHDLNWTVMRRRDTTKGFAWIFEKDGKLWLNIKINPDWGRYFKDVYPHSVLPAYHMNKKHWVSVILDGTVRENDVKKMISESHKLCGKGAKFESKENLSRR